MTCHIETGQSPDLAADGISSACRQTGSCAQGGCGLATQCLRLHTTVLATLQRSVPAPFDNHLTQQHKLPPATTTSKLAQKSDARLVVHLVLVLAEERSAVLRRQA